ncbi:MAG: hypothetical protein WC774_05505 [Candidatus Gracilibacteria bacterium]|jgi:hypothetical protein
MKSSKQISTIALLSLLVLTGCTSTQKEVAPTVPSIPAPQAMTTTTPSTSPTQDPIIRTSEVPHGTPAGTENMKASITTQSGIIIAASITPMATDEESIDYQKAFASKISQVVVGKNINGLKVDTVSGASLTTAAFNTFLASN